MNLHSLIPELDFITLGSARYFIWIYIGRCLKDYIPNVNTGYLYFMMVAIEHWSLKKKKSAAENYKKNVYARA